MTATLRIHFEDGTTREIDLGEKCIEIDIAPERRQSIAINETPRGEFKLSYTKPIMEGKKWERIVIEKK